MANKQRRRQRGGAPRSVDPHGLERATVRLTVCVTEEQAEELRQKARQLRLTMSEYIRRQALEGNASWQANDGWRKLA